MKKTILSILFLVPLLTNLMAQKPVNNTGIFKGVKVPQICASGDTSRTPILFQAKISGFAASTKFKYYVGLIAIGDTSNSSAVGVGENLLFKANGNVLHTPIPDFSAGNHDTLTIGSGGEFTGWFGALNNNDIRFSSGSHVYPMIIMQEIKTGTPPVLKYFLTDSIKAIVYSTSTGGNNGTGIYGNSFSKARSIILLYDDTSGASARPVTISYAESDNNTITKMPYFYFSKVNGVPGAWGSILPNALPNGIRRIESKHPFGGTTIIYANKENDATWGTDSTVNPRRGLNPVFIRSDYAPLLAPEIQFVSTITGVNESNTTLKLVVVRKYGNADSSKISFSVSTATATYNADFKTDTTKQIIFKPYGIVSDTIRVDIYSDILKENTEIVPVILKKPVNCFFGNNTSNTIYIYDARKPVNEFTFSGNRTPLYCSSGDTSRTPIVFQARIAGFSPDAKFKYYISFISISDTASTTASGAGTNLFFTNNGNIRYSGSPGFTNGNHDTLTIASSGDYLGWFGGFNTNDSRFTAGKYVYPMIVMQEIDTIIRPIIKYYLRDSILVLKYSASAGSTNGTAVYGNSFAKNKNIVILYDAIIGLPFRPVAITYLESEGSTMPKVPYFYSSKVNGVSGAWGTILPNSNANGVKKIEVIDPLSPGIFEYANTEADATWGNDSTINPHGGFKPVHIKSDYAPLVAPDIQFVSSSTNVTESNTTIKLGVRRKYGNNDTTKVNYFVAASSATAGVDYTFNTGKTLVFKPYGDVLDTVTITMNILDDINSEPNENVAVKLSVPINGIIGTQTTNTVNIIDNDIPQVYFAKPGITVNEAVGILKVKVKINISPTTPTDVKLVVKYKADSTAIPAEFKIGSSYVDTTLQFSGSKYNDSMEVRVPVINDNFSENRNDTIVLVLRSPTSPARIAKDSLYTLIITDNDAPPIYSFAKKSTSVKENGGTVKFRINVVGRNSNQSDFNLKFVPGVSSATEGKDLTYNPTSQIVTVATTDPDSVIITLPILNNDSYEPNEDAVFIITNALNARIGKPDTMRITIIDDDMVEYPINRVNTSKPVTGVADSLNTKCKLRGIVYGGNLSPGGTPNGFLFTLIDPTGGIQVANSTGNKGYTVTEGDSIYVIGTIGQVEGMVRLQNIDSLVKLAGSRPLKPASSVSLFNESTESNLVKLDVVRIANPSQWPSTAMSPNTVAKVKLVNQTDSFTLLIDSETDIDGTPAPTGFITVTGLGGQTDPTNPFTSGYVIAPRRLTDIQNITAPVFTFATTTSSTAEQKVATNPFVLQGTNIISNQQVSIELIGGTAKNGEDYQVSSTTRTFILTPAQPSVSIIVNLIDDTKNESPETIIWAIRQHAYGTIIGTDSIHTQTLVDNETVDINQVLANETKVYPNPAKDVLNINTSAIIREVSVYDMNGKAIFTKNDMDGMETSVNIEALAKGIYTISIVTEKGVVTKTFNKVD